MSIQLIQQYYAKVEKMIRYGGTCNESTLLQVTVDDTAEPGHTFDMLMGDAVLGEGLPTPLGFIQTHATAKRPAGKAVRHLDI